MSLVKKLCDCGESRWIKCAHPWYMKQFRRKYEPNLTRYAREVLARTDWQNTKTEAEGLAEQIRQAIRAGTYQAAKTYAPPAPAAPIPQGLTVAALAKLYDELSLSVAPDKTKRSKREDRWKLGALCELPINNRRFGDRVMATLAIDDWIAVRAALGDAANSTWAKYRTLIGQFVRWAKWSGHIPIDPIASAPPDLVRQLRRKKAAQRRRRIDAREWANLVEAATESRNALLPLILIALMETAMRIGELLALRWSDVHLDQRHLFVRAEEIGASKTGASRTLEIFDPLYDLLVAMPRTDPAGRPLKRRAFVFGDPFGEQTKSIDKSFLTAVLRAHNIEPSWTDTNDFDARSRAALADIDLNVHDIRHEAACRWLESGQFDLAQISYMLGHASIAQTATYLHTVAANIRRSREAYDAWRKAPQAPAAEAAAGQTAGKTQETSRSAASHAPRPRLLKGAKHLA